MVLSVTPFLGFTPPILERTIQAQFLIHLAAWLGCGILFVTAIHNNGRIALSTIRLRLIASRESSGIRIT